MYKVAYSHNKTLDIAIMNLEKEVKTLQKEGWIAQGGIIIIQKEDHVYTVAQAMIKKN